jgi:hypothetical protein
MGKVVAGGVGSRFDAGHEMDSGGRLAQPWRQLAVAVLTAAAADRRGEAGKGTRHHKVHQRDAAAFADDPSFRLWCDAAGVDAAVIGPALRAGRIDLHRRICTLYPVEDPQPELRADGGTDGPRDGEAADEPTAGDLAGIERAASTRA